MTTTTGKSSITPQRILYMSGSLLVLSGLFHVVVWMYLGGEWEGPISWRKPILFGVSTGVTVISMAWLYPKLRPWKWDKYLCGLFGFAMLAEVALITIQQWRGVMSHFNHSTVLNTLIESWMTYLIIFATLVLVEFTRRCFSSLNAPSDLKLSIRAGMTFLIVSCLIGFATLVYGNYRVAISADPSTFGRAGVAKFPHGVAIHAIQFFPMICWLMCKLDFSLKHRIQNVAYCITAMGTFLVFSLVQTLNGNSRFDVDLTGGLLLLVSVLLFTPVVVTVVSKSRNLFDPTVRADS